MTRGRGYGGHSHRDGSRSHRDRHENDYDWMRQGIRFAVRSGLAREGGRALRWHLRQLRHDDRREHRMHRRHRRQRRGASGFVMRGRFFRPGEVRLALLSLLGDSPQHGYQLMKGLEGRSDGMYKASAGTVYPTLQQLEDEGLIRSDEQGGKRVYSLTSEGERELAEASDTVRRIWRRAEEWGDWSDAYEPDAAEITRPAFALAKAAMRVAARRYGDPRVIDAVRSVLDRALEEIETLGRDRDRDRRSGSGSRSRSRSGPGSKSGCRSRRRSGPTRGLSAS